ncbi:MAG: molybdopterin-dependent oxidoreductase [Desulfovibrio sp.]|jgi:anaerobic selenocysteine-containing dehydrogenase|nr:molybdopterin-dependent oxidoreductase [Desulfovibrio sp.]
MVLDRRGFVKCIAGASAGIMATPLPWKLLDDVSIWTQSWPWIPANVRGENFVVRVVSKTCPSSAAVKVRLVGNRPVRVLPDDDHPLGGGVSALAAAEVHMLHSPARVKRPLLRGPDGAFMDISWSKAAEIFAGKLKEAGGKSAFICGDETGSIAEVISALAKGLGSEDVCLMPSEGQCAAKAAELMRIPGQIGYDLEHSDYVFAIGANIFESWGTVVRNRRIFRAATPHPDGKTRLKARFAYAGPVQNNSAVLARPWLPVYPGMQTALALGVANILIAGGRTADALDFGAFKELALRYTPKKVAQITGVDPKGLESVVNALLAAEAPLVIVGSEFGQGAGAAPVMAGFAVNALLGNINRPGGISLLPWDEAVLGGASSRSRLYANDLAARVGDWAAGGNAPSLLVVHEANPLYALPGAIPAKQAFKNIPFKVAFSSFLDETAEACNLVLPVPMGLERLDDVRTPYGSGQSIYCVSAPVAQPSEDVRPAADFLFSAAKELDLKMGAASYEDLLKSRAEGVVKTDFAALLAGTGAVSHEKIKVPEGYSLCPAVLEKNLMQASAETSFRLAPFVKLNLGTANTGIPPYNTKTLRASELEGKDMFVMMNAATTAKAGLAEGDAVTLEAGGRRLPARLRVFEGVMSDTVAVCLGYGHTALDAFSQNKGANVMELLSAVPEPATGLTVWSQAGVAVAKA